MDFKSELKDRVEIANAAVTTFLPENEDYPGCVFDAMRYAVCAPGKRLRPVMIHDMCRAYGGNTKEAEPFMAAMEYIHTASLVHDDLPAIDNDDLRRGRATTHVKYGEAMGILTGDALTNYAFEVIFKGIMAAENKENALKAGKIIADKSGSFGMLGGQCIDVESDKGRLKLNSLELLDYTYERKTCALIEASLMAGAALAGAADDELRLLENIGSDIGMAFQIRDDILDVISDTQTLGKPVHSDEKNNKETYISILGESKAQERVNMLTDRAFSNAGRLSCDSEFLKGLILYLQDRAF